MISEYTKEDIDQYVSNHIPPGDFLRAVLENNLMEAMGRADKNNQTAIFDICTYIYNHVPFDCHGSKEKVEAWLADKIKSGDYI
ncbi:hypothetical protein LCGC14_1397480 [marine sediment metagenome]|uniref:Uncharacterized protein n=1 Tax=marine sediment metagenome TaxID=412755 RepID=A0A0F9MDN8_9ZZZZ